VALQEMFGSGSLSHRMPPPRRSADQRRPAEHRPSPEQRPSPEPRPSPELRAVPERIPAEPRRGQHAAVPQPVPQTVSQAVPQQANAAMDGQQSMPPQSAGGPVPPQMPVEPSLQGKSLQS
jgi:hypothetical protein